jgi:hypothetical protein
MEMGRHLLNREQNDVVEVHEVRGFLSDDIMGAMQEVDAASRGTRATQPLFSVSLSPPPNENVRIEVFEGAIARIEERHGLIGQPRVVVFHEKEGRRHCHAVWSRIDAETMTAIQMSHFKRKLREISRELYIENGWRMPNGLMNSKERDPRNFTLDQWQQAKRIGRNAGELRSIMQECYACCDSRQAFAKALEERGLYLAKGDRRSHVAVTYEGEVLSVTRYTGKKSKEVTAKLGKAEDAKDLLSVEDTRARIASIIVPKLHGLRAEADQAKEREMATLDQQRLALKQSHAEERARMDSGIAARNEAETRQRSERMRHGLRGLLDRVTGAHARVVKQNEMEAYMSLLRDREQRQSMVVGQLREQREIADRVVALRQRHADRIAELHRDIARQIPAPEPKPASAHQSGDLGRLFESQTPQALLDRLNQPRPDRSRDPRHDLDR